MPGSFNGLVSLNLLSLEKNRLAKIDENCFGPSLANLKHLDLGHNQIREFEQNSFRNLTKLDMLNLRGNLLEKFDPSLLAGLNYLR